MARAYVSIPFLAFCQRVRRAKPSKLAWCYGHPRAAAALLMLTTMATADGVCAQPHALGETLVLHRGVSLVGWYSWPAVGSSPGSYADDPYPQKGGLSEAEVTRLRALGFDFVRLPVDPGPLLAADPSRRARLLARIGESVARLRQAGLNVVWDYHPPGRNLTYGFAGIFTETAPLAVPYRALLADTAALLVKQPGTALEIINEPAGDCTRDEPAADRIMRAAYVSIRSRAPRLPLVVEGACLASIDGLVGSGLASLALDPQVIFSFHFYEPNLFALQGDPGTASPLLRNLNRLPYPASGGDASAIIRRFGINLAQDSAITMRRDDALASGSRAITRYLHSLAGAGLIAERFGLVSKWAAAHGIAPQRILLGEFGAVRFDGTVGAEPADREQWLTDVRRQADVSGFGWCFWAYFDPRNRMSLVLAPERQVDAETARALGLNAPGTLSNGASSR